MPNTHAQTADHAKPAQLGVAICTHNNIDTIERCLTSILPIASEVVVVDSGSSDGTPELAAQLGARVVHHDWEGMVGQRKFALTLIAHHPWVLFLDSDESIDETMSSSITSALRENKPDVSGYEIHRMVFFLGDWLRHTFQPEWRLRLVRPEHFSITGVGPNGEGGHDKITVSGRVERLEGLCRHDTWRDLNHLFERQIFFAERAAKYTDKGGKITDVLFRPAITLLKLFVLKKGYRDGPRGFITCAGMALGVAMKHVYIMRKKRLN